MTKERALLILDPVKGLKTKFEVGEWGEAIDMAVAALRAQAEAEKNEPLTEEVIDNA